MAWPEIVLRIVGAALSLTAMGCLLSCLYWLCSDVPLEERNRVSPVRTTTILIVAALVAGIMLNYGLRFMLSFIPESIGSADEYGEWTSATTSIAFWMAVVGVGGLAHVYAVFERHRMRDLLNRAEMLELTLRPLGPLYWAHDLDRLFRYRVRPRSRTEAEERLDSLQPWNARFMLTESTMLERSALKLLLNASTRVWSVEEETDLDELEEESDSSDDDPATDEVVNPT